MQKCIKHEKYNVKQQSPQFDCMLCPTATPTKMKTLTLHQLAFLKMTEDLQHSLTLHH